MTPNSPIATLLLALAASAVLVGVAQAAPEAERPTAQERWQSMSPEARAAAKERMRARWEAMSPEERAAARKRFQERQPRAGSPAAVPPQGEAAPR